MIAATSLSSTRNISRNITFRSFIYIPSIFYVIHGHTLLPIITNPFTHSEFRTQKRFDPCARPCTSIYDCEYQRWRHSISIQFTFTGLIGQAVRFIGRRPPLSPSPLTYFPILLPQIYLNITLDSNSIFLNRKLTNINHTFSHSL